MFQLLKVLLASGAVMGFFVASLPQSIGGSRPPRCIWDSTIDQIICYGTDGSIIDPDASSEAWPPEGWVPVRVLGDDGEGNRCETTMYRPPSSIIAPEDVNQYDGGTRDPTTYPACPGQVGNQLEPRVIAASYWEAIPVPRPQPYIAPGWAITGKAAYLETNGELTMTYSTDTPIGALVIEARARYYVDWGDGERTGPYRFEGKPWPHGEIVHHYIWTGEKDIVVTARWDATWRLAGESGALRDRDVTSRIDDFPVRQIQAVIISGR